MKSELFIGDSLAVLKTLPDESVNCVVTSPPYWNLRNYDIEGQLGLEPTPGEYISKMTAVFHEVKRILKNDGTCWINISDTYSGGGRGSGYSEKQDSNRGTVDMPRSIVANGFKPKDLCGIPWRLAFALQADGWYLRQDIIWAKSNPMPESVTDRCTKSHEYIFLLTKSAKYWYDAGAIAEPITESTIKRVALAESRDKDEAESKEHVSASYKRCNAARVSVDKYADGRDHLVCKPRMKNIQPDGQQPNSFHVSRAEGEPDKLYPIRNRRSVWTISTQPYPEAHFATFPEEIPRLCISAGCPPDGVVLDCFAGSGTSLIVAARLRRSGIGIELNPQYQDLIEKRMEEFSLFVHLVASVR